MLVVYGKAGSVGGILTFNQAVVGLGSIEFLKLLSVEEEYGIQPLL